MSMIVTHKYSFFLSVVLFCNVIGAITINDQDINNVLKPGEKLFCESSASDNIAFVIENGNLKIGSARINNVKDVFNRFVEFNNEPHGKMIGPRWYISGSVLNDQHVSSDKELIIDARNSFVVAEAVLQSKKITMITDAINCGNCFIDSDELIIKVRSADASYAVIRLIRNKYSQNPMVIGGNIDFANNGANGALIVLGAQYASVAFNPDAFK